MYGLEGTEYEPSQEEIEEAARLANANSFIEVSFTSACMHECLFVFL
jgi:ABC-type multidrug transport system fused ATPase/permease subunit